MLCITVAVIPFYSIFIDYILINMGKIHVEVNISNYFSVNLQRKGFHSMSHVQPYFAFQQVIKRAVYPLIMMLTINGRHKFISKFPNLVMVI